MYFWTAKSNAFAYIGANTPEFGEACYQQSSLANRRLVEGFDLILERDETDRDANGRLLRYVYANGLLVERQLITEGLCRGGALSFRR